MDEGILLNGENMSELQSPNEDLCLISAESDNWPTIAVKNRSVSDAAYPMQIPIADKRDNLPVQTILLTDIESIPEKMYAKRIQAQEELSANPVATDYLTTNTPNPLDLHRIDNIGSIEMKVVEKHAPDVLFGQGINDTYTSTKLMLELKKQFECKICHKCFPLQSKLNRHFRNHNELRPFQCDICSKCFRQKSELFRHYLIHSGKTFSCSACEKCFTTKDVLNRHYRTHTGEQPFVCDVCFRGFSQKSTLLTHYRVHTKEKPYKCEICNKCFSRKYRLKTHSLKHANEN